MRPFQPSHLYVQIRNELARRIATASYPPGSQLPNEFALANEMQVSVGTIRKAVEMLNAEKLVSRSQGRGTVVADRLSDDFRSIFDRIRNSDGSAIAWNFHERSRELREPDAEERHRLRLRQPQMIHNLRRIRDVDGAVVKAEHVRMPLEMIGEIDGLAAIDTTIENLCYLRGIHISSLDESLSFVKAPEEIARLFELPHDTLVLRMERFVYDGADVPLEWRIAYCLLGDRQYRATSAIGGKPPK